MSIIYRQTTALTRRRRCRFDRLRTRACTGCVQPGCKTEWYPFRMCSRNPSGRNTISHLLLWRVSVYAAEWNIYVRIHYCRMGISVGVCVSFVSVGYIFRTKCHICKTFTTTNLTRSWIQSNKFDEQKQIYEGLISTIQYTIRDSMRSLLKFPLL